MRRAAEEETAVKEIDARGLACPQPVLKTKDALASAEAGDGIRVVVDNKAARDNVVRFAQSGGHSARVVSEKDGDITVEVTCGERPCETCSPSAVAAPPVVFVGSDTMGRGDYALGAILMGAMLGALPETSPRPSAVVFMNAGVKLAVKGSAVLDKIKRLEELGMEILVCGTCLDYYHMRDKVAAGKVSNMFTILETFLKAGNVVSV
jgi:selenium metabolism protein YedF